MKGNQEVVKCSLDIVGANADLVNDDFVIILSKKTSYIFGQHRKKSCKILKFTPEWNFDEIMSTISRLESQNYPNLFIFIIVVKNFGFEEKLPEKVKILQEILINFNKSRPIILQLTSKNENVSKFYFKEENSEEIQEVKEQDEEVVDFHDFPTFLWLYLERKIENFQNKMLEKLPKVKNSSLILRFLRTLELSWNFFTNIIQKCAAEGSKMDFCAATDINIDENGGYQESELKLQEKYEQEELTTTIQTALRNKNQEVIDFFIKNYKNFIEKLQFHQKCTIARTAHESGQFTILCDLIAFWDFPFPSNINQVSIINERLLGIIAGRKTFFVDILAENVKEMTKFFQNNPNLVRAFSLENKSAINYALDFNKLQSCFCIIENLSRILDKKDLKIFILENEIINKVVCSSMDMKDIGLLLDMIEDQTDSKFVSDSLKVKDDKDFFAMFVNSGRSNIQRFRGYFKILKKFLNYREIIKMIMRSNRRRFNILHECVMAQDTRLLAILFKVLKELFDSMNCPQKFEELVKQKTEFNRSKNIVQCSTSLVKKEHHQTLWRLLLNTFENRKQLKDLILKTDSNCENIIYNLVIHNNYDVIEFTFRKMKEVFSDSQYRDILESRGQLGRNLLKTAAIKTTDVKKHQFLWKTFREFCGSDDKFLDMLMADYYEINLFHRALQSTSGEVFEFMINELETITTREGIRKIMSQKYQKHMNWMILAVYENKNLNLHQSLWKIIRKFYDLSEVLDMIKHPGNRLCNLLHNAFKFSTDDIIKLTWNEIQNIFSTTELIEIIKRSNSNNETVFHILISKNNENSLKYFWTQFENLFVNQNTLHEFRELISQKTLDKNEIILHIAAKNTEIKVHETMWELLPKTFENRVELLDLIMQEDKDGNNFVHFLVDCNNLDLIEFSLLKIKEIFIADWKRIIHSKGQSGRSLLQVVQKKGFCINNYKFLWTIIKESCESDEEFLKIVNENVINYDKTDILEFIVDDLEKITSREKIKKNLKIGSEKLLQKAGKNKNFESYQRMWGVVKKYFDSSEILDMLRHTDEYGNNLLLSVVINNTYDAAKLTWNEIKNVFSENLDAGFADYLKHTNNEGRHILHVQFEVKKDEDEYFLVELQNCLSSQELVEMFSQKTKYGYNILQYAYFYCSLKYHQILWRFMSNISLNSEVLMDLIMETNKYGNNYIHSLCNNFKKEIFEFTIGKFKEILSADQYDQILKSKGQSERNLLQQAVYSFNDKKRLQFLWKIIRDFYKSDARFLEFLKEVDDDSYNVFHIVACFSSANIFEFMIIEVIKMASDEEIKNILRTFGKANRNLLQFAAFLNNSVELHQILWKVIRNYLNPSEVLDMIKNLDDDGDHVLSCADKNSAVQTIKLIWMEIQNRFTSMPNNNTNLKDYLKFTNNEGQNVLNCLANVDKVEFHETLWRLLLNTFENRDELLNLIMQGYKNGENFVHRLVMSNEADVIEFYFKKLREVYNDDQYKEILNSKGYFNKNLFQLAAAEGNKSLKAHQTLWKIFREYFNDSQIFDIIKHTDDSGDIVLIYVILFNTEEVVMFIWNQMRDILINAEHFDQRLVDLLNEYDEHLMIVLDNDFDEENEETLNIIWSKIVKEFEFLNRGKLNEY